MKRASLYLAIAFGSILPTQAPAHPHVFVDTSLTVTLGDERKISSVEIAWAYDEFYSLLILQDMGLDDDADGVLTELELSQLQGWDMKWVEGYQGDLYLTDADGGEVALSPPIPVVTKVLNGRIVSVHRRAIGEPVKAHGATLRAYDPEFYTAYDLTGGVKLNGAATGCDATITRPEEGEAYQQAKAVMSEFPESATEVPLLGHIFAETVTISCQQAD